MSDDIRYWLALLRAPKLGPAAWRDLLARFGTPQAILEAPRGKLRDFRLEDETVDYFALPDWPGVDRDLAWGAQPGNHILTLRDGLYPHLLKEAGRPPPVLFVHGRPEVLGHLQLAMVGSRNPTSAGGETAYEFARHLAGAGLAITSGLAVGVDAAAHRGALAGGGVTIAVTGTGLDRVYPARNRDLAHEIAERGGALVSEFPTGVPPLAEHFPRRNRIIAGLSLGTLVVEAALRSGSLITARYAAEQGREVFAIPGSIHNPLAKGCHQLLRQGAKLVETAEDILEELGALAGAAREATPVDTALDQWTAAADEAAPADGIAPAQPVDGEYRALLDAMGYDPTPIDVLVERSGLTPEAVSSMLLVLELHGDVASSAGGLYARVTKRR